MSGICKYPESVCPHMTVLKGKSYCDATPCQLTGELPKQSNADRIRNMTDEELADFLFSIITEKEKDFGFVRIVRGEKYDFPYELVDWLKHPVED